jgi:hypothetical protein
MAAILTMLDISSRAAAVDRPARRSRLTPHWRDLGLAEIAPDLAFSANLGYS